MSTPFARMHFPKAAVLPAVLPAVVAAALAGAAFAVATAGLADAEQPAVIAAAKATGMRNVLIRMVFSVERQEFGY
ncbi:hypothetical protein [Catenulispora acidiphila]|uniref:hypothetical protein n=1 Tax=Catenulispora acidiphila TaxID=304895 RepID=UPI0005A1669C|nr:hypothetical protein [Catenulispora acidiphila]